MTRSFITPRPKKLFADDTKLWLIFVVVSIAVIVGVDRYFVYQNGHIIDSKHSYETKIKEAKYHQEHLHEEQTKLKTQIKKIDDTQANNVLLEDTVRNLFDLVPDPIVLAKVQMDDQTLVLEGITPTKEVYNYLLYPPLKSIFQTTKTSFQAQRGGYGFVSFNRKETPTHQDDGTHEEEHH